MLLQPQNPRKSQNMVNLKWMKNIENPLDDLLNIDFTKSEPIKTENKPKSGVIKTDNPGLDSILSLYNQPVKQNSVPESQKKEEGKFVQIIILE